MKKFLILFGFTLFLLSCDGKDPVNPGIVSNTTVENGIVTVIPYESGEAFQNPMKGWREFFGPGVDKRRSIYPYPFGSMIKEYMQWNMMEDKATDGVDKIIEYCNHRWEDVEKYNVKVIPRPLIVWMEPCNGGYAKNTYTDNPDDLNGFHWPSDIPNVVTTDGSKKFCTGYWDPSFPERLTNLIMKLGEAWDNDPRVAYVEMGFIGEFGEHHCPFITTGRPPHTQAEHDPNVTWLPGIEKVLGDAFTKAFKNKKVMVRHAFEFNDYDFGLYLDSWAADEDRIYGYEDAMKNMRGRWKDQVIGGEITWGYSSFLSKGLNSLEKCLADERTYAEITKEIRELHCNHLGGVTWANWEGDMSFVAKAGDVQKMMGYRFVLKEFKYPARIGKGSKMNISFSVVNNGSSPFYYDWPVEISILNAETKEAVWKKTLSTPKISTWMPGDNWDVSRNAYSVAPELYTVEEEITYDGDLPAGSYIIAIAVLDPSGNLPSLRFANFNYFNGGRHPMGNIGIDTDLEEYMLKASKFDSLKEDHSLHYTL